MVGSEVPTPPAVSEAMREAVAQYLDGMSHLQGAALIEFLLRPSGPIASEIARLTGERDAANEKARETGTRVVDLVFENTRTNARADAAEAALSRLQADRDAEVGKLRAALADLLPSVQLGEVHGAADFGRTTISVRFGDIRRARALLTPPDRDVQGEAPTQAEGRAP